MKIKSLSERFVSDFQLKGYAKRSIQSYTRALRQFQNFCNKQFEDITEEELKRYWLFCKNELKWSPATLRISYSGIRHFFTYTLKRDWAVLWEVKFERHATLPTVLSVDEVRLILKTLTTPQNKTFYEVVYSLGLRLGEALTLQVRDIDSKRMMVHVHLGKGARDRLVPLPETTLKSLRNYWKTHRNPKWIFPGLSKNGKGGSTAQKHVATGTVQRALNRAMAKLKIKKHVHPHTFRHSYATHLIEAGVPVRHVQIYLGHASLVNTMVYLHLTTAGEHKSCERINQLMRGVIS